MFSALHEGMVVARSSAGHDISCPYELRETDKTERPQRNRVTDMAVPSIGAGRSMLRPYELLKTGSKEWPQGNYALGVDLPSMGAGHGMPCPYGETDRTDG